MILFIYNKYNNEKQKKFDRIYDEYYRYAYKIAFNVIHNSSDMEDILQEVFKNVWRTIDIITDDSSAKAWISAIARNTAINFLKKKISDNEKIADVEEEIFDSFPSKSVDDPAEIVVNAENVESIYSEMGKMDKRYSDVLLLKFKFHLTPEKIAKCLNRKVKTVYTQLNRGKELLKENLLSKERQIKNE